MKDWYEYLPTIYIVAGLALGLVFDGMLGRYSAALLIAAGTLVFNWRIAHRSARKGGV